MFLSCGAGWDPAADPGGNPGNPLGAPVNNRRAACQSCPTIEHVYAVIVLPPVPFHKNPAAPLANIVMRYPVGTRTWRLFPPSLVPTVSVAIPCLLPGNPHVLTAGRPPPPLIHSTGWPDANHHVGRRGAEGQRACKNQSQQSLKKHNNFSFSQYQTANQSSGRRTTTPFSVSGRGRGPVKPLSRSPPPRGCRGRVPLRQALQRCGTASHRQKRRQHPTGCRAGCPRLSYLLACCRCTLQSGRGLSKPRMTSSRPFVPSMNVAKKRTGRKRQRPMRSRVQAQARCDILSVGSCSHHSPGLSKCTCMAVFW